MSRKSNKLQVRCWYINIYGRTRWLNSNGVSLSEEGNGNEYEKLKGREDTWKVSRTILETRRGKKTREITWHGGTKPKAHNLATRAPRWHESGRSRRGRGREDIGEGTHDVQATNRRQEGRHGPTIRLSWLTRRGHVPTFTSTSS